MTDDEKMTKRSVYTRGVAFSGLYALSLGPISMPPYLYALSERGNLTFTSQSSEK